MESDRLSIPRQTIRRGLLPPVERFDAELPHFKRFGRLASLEPLARTPGTPLGIETGRCSSTRAPRKFERDGLPPCDVEELSRRLQPRRSHGDDEGGSSSSVRRPGGPQVRGGAAAEAGPR